MTNDTRELREFVERDLIADVIRESQRTGKLPIGPAARFIARHLSHHVANPDDCEELAYFGYNGRFSETRLVDDVWSLRSRDDDPLRYTAAGLLGLYALYHGDTLLRDA